jgi:hypothetical protein
MEPRYPASSTEAEVMLLFGSSTAARLGFEPLAAMKKD